MADRVSPRRDPDPAPGRPGARSPRRAARALMAAAAALALSACAVGPDYRRPVQDVGTAYAHAPEGRWIPADTQPRALPADWWTLFGDAVLDDLMDRMPRGNLDLAQAEAQFREARAALDSARAGLFPTLGVSGSMNRAGEGVSGPGNPGNTYSLSATASWEVDLWGRVRRDVEAARAGEQASAADLDAMRLSLRSTLAQAYFGVRSSQLQDALLARTLDEYARALEMTRNRLAAGVASPADVAAASAQLDQARAQRIRLGWQREQQIHAIAVLLGQVPASFRLSGGAGLPAVPDVPVGVPSALLLRRPDVAGAERRTAQANARIGVAQAAWFPDLTLSAQGGYRAAEFASWIMAPARFWTLGPPPPPLRRGFRPRGLRRPGGRLPQDRAGRPARGRRRPGPVAGAGRGTGRPGPRAGGGPRDPAPGHQPVSGRPGRLPERGPGADQRPERRADLAGRARRAPDGIGAADRRPGRRVFGRSGRFGAFGRAGGAG